jgi:hypothetical protein
MANNNTSVLARLDTIETLLGIRKNSDASVPVDLDAEEDLDTEQDEHEDDFPFYGVWRALARLRGLTKPTKQDERIWSRSVVRQLWQSYVSTFSETVYSRLKVQISLESTAAAFPCRSKGIFESDTIVAGVDIVYICSTS